MCFELWHLSSLTLIIHNTSILITSIHLPCLYTELSFYFGISGLKTIQQMSPKTKAILLTIGIILLGFFREYLFININWIYLTLVNGRMNQALDEFHFLLSWSPSELLNLKWGLTALFTVLFFALTWWIIKLVFKEKSYTKSVGYLYLALIGIAGILVVLAKLTNQYNTLYGAIHNLMSLAQSFMPLMMLFVLFTFFKREKSPSR